MLGWRIGISFCAALLTSSCAHDLVEQVVKTDREANRQCVTELADSADGKVLYARLWRGNDTDTVDKLTDRKPLTKEERDTLLRFKNKSLNCRQIVIAHDTQYAAWELPYWQELWQRPDAIHVKLMAGEIPVGIANRLLIESYGKFQADISRGRADAVRVEEAQRQRAAEALLASMPKTTTSNCTWIGNSLNCNSIRY
jgi:hypothetical protein